MCNKVIITLYSTCFLLLSSLAHALDPIPNKDGFTGYINLGLCLINAG